MIIKKVKIANENYPDHIALKPKIGEEYLVFSEPCNHFGKDMYLCMPHVKIYNGCGLKEWDAPLINPNWCEDIKLTKAEEEYIKGIEIFYDRFTGKMKELRDRIYNATEDKNLYNDLDTYIHFPYEVAIEYFFDNEGYDYKGSYIAGDIKEYYEWSNERYELIKCFIIENEVD